MKKFFVFSLLLALTTLPISAELVQGEGGGYHWVPEEILDPGYTMTYDYTANFDCTWRAFSGCEVDLLIKWFGRTLYGEVSELHESVGSNVNIQYAVAKSHRLDGIYAYIPHLEHVDESLQALMVVPRQIATWSEAEQGYIVAFYVVQ